MTQRFTSLGKKGDNETSTYPSLSCAGSEEKDDSNVVPFLTTRLAICTNLLFNVMLSKHFLSHLIWTLSWCLKKGIRLWWEKFPPSYNPFFHVVQITILDTLRIARNATGFSPFHGGKTLPTTLPTSSNTICLESMQPVHSLTWLQNGRTRLQ